MPSGTGSNQLASWTSQTATKIKPRRTRNPNRAAAIMSASEMARRPRRQPRGEDEVGHHEGHCVAGDGPVDSPHGRGGETQQDQRDVERPSGRVTGDLRLRCRTVVADHCERGDSFT